MQGQAPERGQAGNFLHRSSVPGQKVAFVEDSTVASGSLVVPAGGSASVVVNLTLSFDGLIKESDQAVAWVYDNIFVDTNNDFNFELDDGPSLSSGQLKVGLRGPRKVLTPPVGKTHQTIYAFSNTDASPHTVYITAQYKYVVTG